MKMKSGGINFLSLILAVFIIVWKREVSNSTGFAVPCLTTWLLRQNWKSYYNTFSLKTGNII